MHTARQAVLDVFDRLFEKAADKLDVSYTPEDLADARRNFEARSAAILTHLSSVEMGEVPADVISDMEKALDSLSPTEVVGHLATIPLMHKVQEVLRLLARRAAEQRMLEHMLSQVDDRYGGN